MDRQYKLNTSDKANYAEYNLRNIYERVTKYNAVFLSIDALDFVGKSSGAPTPKMKLRCCVLDEKDSHVTKEITVFIPIGRFLLLAHNVLTGVYASQKRARSSSREAQGTNEWPEPYFTQVGAKYGKSTGSDGDKDYSRKFSIVDGRSNDMAFAFLLSEAEGTVNNLGGVSQNKGAKPTTIYIGMPNDDLKEFALIGKAYIEQYISFDLVTRLKAVRKQRDVYAGSKNHKP